MFSGIQDIAVVGCIYGTEFAVVHPAPKGVDSYFFSNNFRLKSHVEKRGWKFIYHDVPLSDDEFRSSMQSKYVKFLQFIESRRDFFKYNHIVYCDHKLRLLFEHVLYLCGTVKKPITFRKHNAVRRSVWDEFSAAMLQKRYAKSRIKTYEYIEKKLESGYNEVTQIMLTGLIVYNIKQYSLIKYFTDDVYYDINKIQSPECQIIVSMVAQKYKEIIQIIDHDFMKLEYDPPMQNHSVLNRLRKNVLRDFDKNQSV